LYPFGIATLQHDLGAQCQQPDMSLVKYLAQTLVVSWLVWSRHNIIDMELDCNSKAWQHH